MERMQVAIDGCKRIYEVDPNDEIKRIRAMDCMKFDKDYPAFMKYTFKIPATKNGKDRPYEDVQQDNGKLKKRIDYNIECPMCWVEDCLNKIQGSSTTNTTDTLEFLIEKPKKRPNKHKQIEKIRNIVESYDSFVNHFMAVTDFDNEEIDLTPLENKQKEVKEAICTMKISIATMHRLIQSALRSTEFGRRIPWYKKASKHTMAVLNVLYMTNKDLFLSCFKRAGQTY